MQENWSAPQLIALTSVQGSEGKDIISGAETNPKTGPS